jgi:hypothetical protein
MTNDTPPESCPHCGCRHYGTKDICDHCIQAERDSINEDINRDNR